MTIDPRDYYSEDFFDAWDDYERRIDAHHKALTMSDDSSRSGYIYFLEMEPCGLPPRDMSVIVKIGYSKNPNYRLKQINKSSVVMPYNLKFLNVCWAEDCRDAEALMHRLLGRYRLDGEWFHLPQNIWHAVYDLWYVKGSRDDEIQFRDKWIGAWYSPLAFFEVKLREFQEQVERHQAARESQSA